MIAFLLLVCAVDAKTPNFRCFSTGDAYTDPSFPSFRYYVLFCNTTTQHFIERVVCDQSSLTATPTTLPSDGQSLVPHILPFSEPAADNCSETLTKLTDSVFECAVNGLSNVIKPIAQSPFPAADLDTYRLAFEAQTDLLFADFRLSRMFRINLATAFVPTFYTAMKQLAELKTTTPKTTITSVELHHFCQAPLYVRENGGEGTKNPSFSIANGCDVSFRKADVLCRAYTTNDDGVHTAVERDFYQINQSTPAPARFAQDAWLNNFDSEVHSAACFVPDAFIAANVSTFPSVAQAVRNCSVEYSWRAVRCFVSGRGCKTHIVERAQPTTITDIDSVEFAMFEEPHFTYVDPPFGVQTRLSMVIPTGSAFANITVRQLPIANSSTCPELYCVWFPLTERNRTHNTYLAADPFTVELTPEPGKKRLLQICSTIPYVDNATWDANSTYVRGTFFRYTSDPCNLERIDALADPSFDVAVGQMPAPVVCLNVTQSGTYYIGAVVDIRMKVETPKDVQAVLAAFVVVLVVIIVVMMVMMVVGWVREQVTIRRERKQLFQTRVVYDTMYSDEAMAGSGTTAPQQETNPYDLAAQVIHSDSFRRSKTFNDDQSDVAHPDFAVSPSSSTPSSSLSNSEDTSDDQDVVPQLEK